MSITVNKIARPSFEPKTLVISSAPNGNIYLVVGPGDTPDHFAGVRLSGTGRFCYQNDLIKDMVVPFHGEVVIKND